MWAAPPVPLPRSCAKEALHGTDLDADLAQRHTGQGNPDWAPAPTEQRAGVAMSAWLLGRADERIGLNADS